MNKNEKPSFLKGKGAAVATVICFVAVITMVGAFTFQELSKPDGAGTCQSRDGG